MLKKSKHIEIVRSSRGDLSSLGLASATGILNVLEQEYNQVGITTINTLQDLERLVNLKPDLVFLGMKYVPDDSPVNGKNIWIQEYLQEHGIATTGSNSTAHRIELDKSLAKECALDAGIVTSPYYVSRQNSNNDEHQLLTFPLFVKPSDRGGGQGIDNYSVVHNALQLDTKIASITLNHNCDSLIEQYLPGREFSVAILYDEDTGVLHTMPLELIAPLNQDGDRFLSKAIKKADSESTKAIDDEKLRLSVNILALSIFRALGASDYGRIDIRLDADGVPNFLEANLIPSLLDKYGNFPKAAMLNKSMPHAEIISKIAKLGFNKAELMDTAKKALVS